MKNIFERALRAKLRFQTSRGNLTTEQLWDLGLTMLDKLAVEAQEAYEKSGKKSFLSASTAKNREDKLRFEVLKKVLLTKKDEAEAARLRRALLERRDQVVDMIARKEEHALGEKSLEDLNAVLADLEEQLN